jgi:hypothetical protein
MACLRSRLQTGSARGGRCQVLQDGRHRGAGCCDIHAAAHGAGKPSIADQRLNGLQVGR